MRRVQPRRPPFLDNAVGAAETNNRDFRTDGAPVTSPKGAKFAMQVMPHTAADPGFGLRPANPNDAADMNRLGREYRAVMYRRYGGDVAKMAAAYNWGPGNLDRALQTHGDNWLQAAPAETHSYIQRVFAHLGGQ